MIPFSEKEKQYLELAAKGFSDSEMAQYMNVSLSTIQNGYRVRISDKIELSTKGEIVTYARQNGYGGIISTEDTDIERLSRVVRGVTMAPVRSFYRLLERHYKQNDCPGCKSYKNYHTLLIPGDWYTHLERFATDEYSVDDMLRHLKRFHILEEQHNDGICRLTFTYLLREELRS